MSDENKKKLLRRRTFLVNHLHFDSIANDLIEENIISVNEKQKIEMNATDNQKVERFLDIFPRKSNEAFEVLIGSLRKCGQAHVADELSNDP